jgi:hypothetical protein
MDLHLLKIGRHFRLNPGLKIVVARDQGENERLHSLAKSGTALFQPTGFRGPTALACGTVDQLTEQTVGEIVARYSQDGRISYPIRKEIIGQNESIFAVDRKFDKEALAILQVGAI